MYWNLLAFSPSVKPKLPPSSTAQLTNHIVAMKPIVPNTRMGGKSFSVSILLSFKMVNATVLDKANVGM